MSKPLETAAVEGPTSIKYHLPGLEGGNITIPLGHNGQTNRWGGSMLVYPTFAGRKVCVLPGAFAGSIAELFVAGSCRYENDYKKADFVVFSGGVDVDPSLYDEIRRPETQTPSISRDKFEQEVFDFCITNGVPMIGICRGAQFLHVMNGGKLWQHVSGHGGNDHYFIDHEMNILCDTTSLHHQQLRYQPGLEVVAACTSRLTSVFNNGEGTFDNLPIDKHYLEIEAGKYTSAKCWFTQGHPEIGSPSYRGWFMYKVSEFLKEVDFGWNNL